MRRIIVVLTILVGFYGNAQSTYTFLTIPKELTHQANAVIRSQVITVELTAVNRMKVTTELIVTVFNDVGDKHARALEFYDGSIRIKSQEAYIYGKFGDELEHFKRGDFKDISAITSGDLYNDNRYKYLDYTPTEYPYTLHYTSEVETQQTAFIQPWHPIPGHYVSVEHSSYRFINTRGIPFRHKETNLEGYPIEKEVSDSGLTYTLSASPSIPAEEMEPELDLLVPGVKIALNRFSLVGVEGEADNWKAFGQWQYENLIKGLDELPQETKDEISGLVAGITDEKEKIKRIYEYVQNKTRYISVQLGIGGWKPYPAEEVDRLGYGDCKGLTNYTKALLATQGIEAYYSIVYAGREKKHIEDDFTSMQGNHVILNVPLDDEEIWLECTSQTMPFNFLGDFTDDRDVLVVSRDGGEIKRTAAYLNEYNLQSGKGRFSISEDGSFTGNVEIQSYGCQYDQVFKLAEYDNTELDKHYKSYWDDHKRLSIEDINLTNDKDAIAFTQEVSVSSKNYGSFINGKFIFKPNAFNTNNYVPKKYRNRRHPFILNRGYKDVDEVIFTVPEGYSADFLPEPVEVETKYGSYKATVEPLQNNSFSYHRELIIKEGTFPAGEYEDYRKFRRTIKKHDNTKVVFIKTN